MPNLRQEAEAWLADDPDPATVAELTELLQQDDPAALADRFAGFLEFGTAGLRGALGAGPNRMNRAVVIRTAAGLMRHLGELPTPRVVIGFDARRNSEVFATDTAAVVTAAGGEAHLLPRPLPTPVLAFAVRHLAADAGVMVTASHNPPQDNGYKVYLGGRMVPEVARGVQIVPPHDEQIAAGIAPSVAAVARAEGWEVLGEEVVSAYRAGVATLVAPGPRELRIVLTALHGVGGELVRTVLQDAGFTDLHVVAEQAEPDPDFPTVSFPNPEEPGAIDLAVHLAEEVAADLVIANDPDADRCAVAVPDPHLGRWRMLHGDELGALLGEQLAGRHDSGVLASSVVSSRLLARIADHHGLQHRSTLTGFKWLARVADLVYGYEEAIGYCVDPEHVRDKDGISAALMVAQLAAAAREQGRSLVDLLDALAVRHGLHLTDQLSVRMPLDQIPAALERLREAPPPTLAGSPVTATELSLPDYPPTAGLVLLAGDDSRVIIRPSGTEPKLKCYLEVIEPVTTVPQSRRDARAHLAAVRADLATVLAT